MTHEKIRNIMKTCYKFNLIKMKRGVIVSLEKMYTVDDIAEKTRLSTRTIRTFLKEGVLKGTKLGGQWRFSEEDVKHFMSNDTAKSAVVDDNRQEVIDFLDGVKTSFNGVIQICTVVDLYISKLESYKKSDDLMALIEKQPQEEYLQYVYDYDENQGRARFTLFAKPEFIVDAVKLLSY